MAEHDRQMSCEFMMVLLSSMLQAVRSDWREIGLTSVRIVTLMWPYVSNNEWTRHCVPILCKGILDI
jgi:hypothetical protein